MPFDLDPKLFDLSPDLARPSLEGLAWMLRHSETWPKGHHWSFETMLRDLGDCGTAGCALGIAELVWGVAKWPGYTDGWATRLGIRPDVGEWIFEPYAYLPVAGKDVTPSMVAERIERYLAGPRLAVAADLALAW